VAKHQSLVLLYHDHKHIKHDSSNLNRRMKSYFTFHECQWINDAYAHEMQCKCKLKIRGVTGAPPMWRRSGSGGALPAMLMQSCGVADSSGCSGHVHAVCVRDLFKLRRCSVVARRSNQAVAWPIQAAAWLTEHGRTHGDKQGRLHGDEERSIQGRRRDKRLTCGTYTSEI
jgi:hypothetical protein